MVDIAGGTKDALFLVRIVERPRAKDERPIVTVAKHRTVTLLPTSVVRSSGELSASVEREFVGDTSVGDGGDQGFDSAVGQEIAEPSVPVAASAEATVPKPQRSKKKRVIYDSEGLPVAPHPPKRLRTDYGTAGGSVTGGKSLSALNRLLQDSRLTVEQGVPALPTLPFITSSVTASPLEEGGDRTDSVTGPSVLNLRSTAPDYDEGLLLLLPRWLFLLTFGKDKENRGSGFDAGEHPCGEEMYVTSGTYHILEKRKWRTLVEEKNTLLEAKDKEIEDLKSQLLRAREESAEVTQLRAQVSGLEATENSLRGEVASAKDRNTLLEQECDSLKLKVTGLESAIVDKDHKLSELGESSSSLKSQNQSLVDQVHELEVSSTDLREKLEMYEDLLKRLEEYQDKLMEPLRTRLAEIDTDFTRCCMRFQENFHPHLLNVIAGRRWLLTHGMKLLVVKCLNSNEYMEALGHAFGRAIEKGMQEGLAAGIEHGQAGRCLTDLEAYIPSAEDDFNSAIRELRDLNFPLLQELSTKKDASTWDIMNLLRLDDAVAETLGMTDLQPDASQLMVPVHRVFASIDDPLSAEALLEPPAEVPATNVLSTVVIVPHADPSVSVEDYDNLDSADVVPENAILGSESEGKIDASAGDGLSFSQLDDEAKDVVL
ncbi:hypothetical protein Tco_0700110 [Tanacetum coccineum]